MITDAKKMAALAVFRSLYDNKKDIFTIICEFIKESVHDRNLLKVNTSLVSSILNEDYGFIIPEAVIDTALKRIATKSKGEYSFSDLHSINGNLDEYYNSITESNNKIIEDLIEYVELKKQGKLTVKEKGILNQSFCEFLISDDTNVEFAEYISAFIISNQSNPDFTVRLNTIKEGVVLYSGLLYNDNLNEIGSWKTALTIYVEPEILFHLAGYNGELYKKLFDDFYALVRCVNTKSRNEIGKSLIKIKYFQEVKEEIDRFFKTAEHIKENEGFYDTSKTAMVSILSGCSTPSDVLLKKAEFETLLKTYNIVLEDEFNFYNEKENEEFNIESQEIINLLSETIPNDEIYPHLKYLYYINVLRRGEDIKQFENAKYILLTGNGRTLQMSLSPHIKNNGCVPLATNLNFITSRFWFKLNKGFSNENYPISFNIINKAQIVLSAQIGNSVSEEFKKIKDKIALGELSSQGALEALAELKSRIRNPEDIEFENVDAIVQSIKERDIEQFLRERELERERSRNTTKRNAELELSVETLVVEQKNKEEHHNKVLLQQQKKYQDYIDAQHDRYLKDLNDAKRKELQETIIPYIRDIEKNKMSADKSVVAKIKVYKFLAIFVMVIATLLVIIFDNRYDLGLINEYKIYVELFVIWLLPAVYLIFVGRTFNLYECYKKFYNRLENRLTNIADIKYNVDRDRLNELYDRKRMIEEQLEVYDKDTKL